MRSVSELLSDESAWPLVESWIKAAVNDVRVLPTERARGEATLLAIQVTTRSRLGAIALETGGLLVDHGWIRILGAGSSTMSASLGTWNGLDEPEQLEAIENAFLVANDAVGGLFALNGGAFDGESGSTFYFAPDTVEWFDMSMDYSGFLHWACSGDVSRFYESLRWDGWQDEIDRATADQGFALYPPPFTKEGNPIGSAQRSLVPIVELCAYYRECARQLAELPEGATFRFAFGD